MPKRKENNQSPIHRHDNELNKFCRKLTKKKKKKKKKRFENLKFAGIPTANLQEFLQNPSHSHACIHLYRNEKVKWENSLPKEEKSHPC